MKTVAITSPYASEPCGSLHTRARHPLVCSASLHHISTHHKTRLPRARPLVP